MSEIRDQTPKNSSDIWHLTSDIRSRSERGNIFLIVLMGVVLFASLAFVISRGMRSETTTSMTARQAEIAATELLEYAQRIERAVSRLRSKGVSENDLDFTNPTVAGYAHTPALTASSQIFQAAGGAVAWQNPASGVNDGSAWLFTGETCVVDVGTGGAGCASDGEDNEELLAVLPNIKLSVCQELNKRLNISSIPSGGAASAAKFTGDFDDDSSPGTTGGLTAACFKNGANYFFYYVVLAR